MPEAVIGAWRNQGNVQEKIHLHLFCNFINGAFYGRLRKKRDCGCGNSFFSGNRSGDRSRTDEESPQWKKAREEETESSVSGEDMEQAGPGSDIPETTEAADPDKKAEAFAEKVQEAVADRDLEALADMLSYPCIFITGDQDTLTIEKRDDLVKQNPDMVFGDDLMVSVANVDTADLDIKDQRVVLGEGESNITFKEMPDGTLE